MKQVKLASFAAILPVLAVLLAGGCLEDEFPPGRVEASPAFLASMELPFLALQMLEQGDLPGFAPGETTGTKQFGALPPPAGEAVEGPDGVRYPLDAELAIEKNGAEGGTVSYVFRKATPGAEWRLLRAWRTDRAGNNPEELFPERADDGRGETPNGETR